MTEVLSPLVLIFSGILSGAVSEKIILKKLRTVAAKTRWAADDVLARSLSGVPFTVLSLVGVYAGFHSSPALEKYASGFNRGFVVVAIALTTIFFTRSAAGYVTHYSRKIGGIFLSTSIFANITRTVIVIIGTLILLQYLNISIAPILTALGVGGLAVALALQDSLSNLFSGVQILASRQIKPGDFVKLASGEEGYIVDITWRHATIRTLPNHLIIIPNAKLASSIVTNFDLPEAELTVLANVGVAYESDMNRVEAVTIDVARGVMVTVSGGIPDFEPFIRYHTFGDFSIDFTVILRCRTFVDQYLVKHEFMKRLHTRYRREGIEIPFPCRTVYLKDNAPEPGGHDGRSGKAGKEVQPCNL